MSEGEVAEIIALSKTLDQWRAGVLKFTKEEGWEILCDTGFVRMFRRPKDGTGPLNEYLTVGELPTVPADTLKQVYLDFEYRKKWDPNTEHWRLLEHKDGTSLMYSSVYYPFPMSKRDYVFERRVYASSKESPDFKLGDGKSTGDEIAILQTATRDERYPPNSSYVRVNEFTQTLIIKSNGQGGSLCATKYYEDPGGTIPKAILNWASQLGLPSFFEKMRQACESYSTWKQR